MIDVIHQIEAVRREVAGGRLGATEARSIRLRRTYAAPIDEVWDALTNPERIGRWFLPISGDYRIGGSYQFEGNAGGRILACDRPSRLRATWVFGPPSDDPASEVEVRLTSAGPESTELELEHLAVVPEAMWDEYGPGAVGVGWEGGLMGLALHLTGGSIDDPLAWAVSDEGRDHSARASAAWGQASRAAGADDRTIARQVANTTAFYTGIPVPTDG